MIDVHVLTMRNLPPYGRRENLKYIIETLSKEPVNVHIVDVDEIGNEGSMRIKGMRQGTAEWVGWVDADDELIVGAYQKLLDNKGATPFVWSNELVKQFNSSGKVVSTSVYKEPHHMMIIHRDILDLEALAAKKRLFGTITEFHKFKSIGTHVNEIGYVWNRHRDSDCLTAKALYK